jgi:hypothetical protein
MRGLDQEFERSEYTSFSYFVAQKGSMARYECEAQGGDFGCSDDRVEKDNSSLLAPFWKSVGLF